MNRVCIFLFFTLLQLNLIAQNTIGLPKIINYNKTDYHGGLQTWDIEQDKNGSMYFANNEGLLTYDGTFWNVHPLPNKTIMRSLAIEPDGKIYVGGQGEIGYFFPDTHGFLRYTSLIPLLPNGQDKFADIWDIDIMGESVFFRATDRIFYLNNNTISVYAAQSAWEFMKVVGNTVFAQDQLLGLFQFRNNKWLPVNNNTLLNNERVSGMIELPEKGILVSTLDRHFFTLQNNLLISNPAFQSTAIHSFCNKMAILNQKEFVLASISEGCFIVNNNGEIIQQISRKEGLQNNTVLCLFLDRDKNLWVGLNNGISFIAYNAAIKYITPNPDNEVSGFSSRIFNNKLFIGTSDGAYTVPIAPNQEDISFTKGKFSLISNSSGQVWHIDEVNQQLLMAHTNGIFQLHGQDATKIAKEPGWLFLPTSAISPAQNIVIGTYTGLKMISYNNQQFKDIGNLQGTYESFRFLAMDNNNQIWASHPYRGVYLLTLSPDNKSYTAQLFTEKQGLPSSLGNHVFKIKNNIVFATLKGPYSFDTKKQRFIPSSFLMPILGENEIRYLNEDESGNIWFSNGKQLGIIDFKRLQGKTENYIITYFPEITGQILSGFENVYPYNNKNIFIASEKGVILLNYEKYTSNPFNLSVLLGTVKAIGKTDSIIFGGYQSTKMANNLKQNLPEFTQLPAQFNSFHFEYSSPTFGLHNNIEYSYHLEGYDKTWSNWTTKSEKDYTNLPNGKYNFQIKARDNLNNLSEMISFGFIVQPSWYNTHMAYLLYALLLVGLLVLLNVLQKKKLDHQKRIYEEKQQQINVQYQLEREKNEKEIIKLQNEKLTNEMFFKNKELADTSMHLVERSDALLKVKDELQKLYKKSNENHDIKKALQLVNDIEKNNLNWENFTTHFDEINNNFLKNLKSRFPKLTPSDLKVCTYLQLNLSSKEIAQLLNISLRGVEISRYRLRKKLELLPEQTLVEFLNQIN
jgi:ligand-binding sensor domain-containing protein